MVETGRRRRWSDDDKLKIVLESLAGPRLVSATARRHGISRSLLVTWRRAFRVEPPRSEKTPTFVPAIIEPAPPEPERQPTEPRTEAPATISRMEIILTCGRRIVVSADVDGKALARVVAVLERR
ncbi:transposase [Acuticoccus sp. I52.16.1]|uniref:IS66-like element accessory protein TnpA n=1 Tax=Acuticoccus sp. I52.16.1 TaxID=2928472 RepID=UPI00352C68B5